MSFSYGVRVECNAEYCEATVDPQDFMIKVQIGREVHVFCSHGCYRDFFSNYGTL